MHLIFSRFKPYIFQISTISVEATFAVLRWFLQKSMIMTQIWNLCPLAFFLLISSVILQQVASSCSGTWRKLCSQAFYQNNHWAWFLYFLWHDNWHYAGPLLDHNGLQFDLVSGIYFKAKVFVSSIMKMDSAIHFSSCSSVSSKSKCPWFSHLDWFFFIQVPSLLYLGCIKGSLPYYKLA